MIDSISTQKCFSAFNSSKFPKAQQEKAPTSVKVASLVGAGVCAVGTAHLIARRQGKALHKAVNLLNVKYNEPELIGVALASIVGGLAAGGAVDDKKYLPIKIKEGIHQTIANVLAPLLLIAGLNKIYDKAPIKKLPQFAENTGIKKVANETVKMLPRLGIAAVGLVGGIYAGTLISNKINGLEYTEKERKVKALDYVYHPDDFAAALAIADKKGVLQKFVSKIIPPIFMLHGYETGTKR